MGDVAVEHAKNELNTVALNAENACHAAELTGEKITSLAYPNGAYNDLVELLAEKCGYLYCFTTNAPTEPYYENTALPRDYVVRDMTIEEFSALFN